MFQKKKLDMIMGLLGPMLGKDLKLLLPQVIYLFENFEAFYQEANQVGEGGILAPDESDLHFSLESSPIVSVGEDPDQKQYIRIIAKVYGKRRTAHGILLSSEKTLKEHPDCKLLKIIKNINLLTTRLSKKAQDAGRKK